MQDDFFDLIVVGAGASGLMAAWSASAKGHSVLVLEKEAEAGRKILVSGGGKCNLTNLHITHQNYTGKNNKFCISALNGFTPDNILNSLAEANIPVEEREHGQIFCRHSARDILALLLEECRKRGVRIECGKTVQEVKKKDERFIVTTSTVAGQNKNLNTQSIQSQNLVIATGGPAFPQCGSDISGMLIAKSMGHKIIPPSPALVPMTMPNDWPLAGLYGISQNVRIYIEKKPEISFTLPLLFTHKGISGPAALQISSYWNKGAALIINFLPDANLDSIFYDRANTKSLLGTVIKRLIPERFVTAITPNALMTRKLAEVSKKDLEELKTILQAHRVIPTGNEGLRKAEATTGGIDTAEISSSTLQSKIVPGLYFCGEVADICGQLGGYNLHWAWASGWLAGSLKALKI